MSKKSLEEMVRLSCCSHQQEEFDQVAEFAGRKHFIELPVAVRKSMIESSENPGLEASNRVDLSQFSSTEDQVAEEDQTTK